MFIACGHAVYGSGGKVAELVLNQVFFQQIIDCEPSESSNFLLNIPQVKDKVSIFW